MPLAVAQGGRYYSSLMTKAMPTADESERALKLLGCSVDDLRVGNVWQVFAQWTEHRVLARRSTQREARTAALTMAFNLEFEGGSGMVASRRWLKKHGFEAGRVAGEYQSR